MPFVNTYEGIIGPYLLEETDECLTRVWLGDRISLVPEGRDFKETALLKEAKAQLDAYFAGKLKDFSLPIAPAGTNFQLKVWKVLQTIPYGETITYGQLAERVGNAKASRAVGMANSRNPLPIIIPCHRVIGANHKLTGYTGGLDIKIKLLNLEGGLLF